MPTWKLGIAATLVLCAAVSAQAESLYVSDRLSVPMRAAVTEGAPVVKNVDSGTALEVLERADKFVHVRDAQGADGWIEARLLMNTAPPARGQLERAQADTAKLSKDLAEAQARVKTLEASLAQESARGAELTKAAETSRASASTPTPATPEPAAASDDSDFPWGWLLLAFAMLWIGFGIGIVWLRERHRKKLGGMYLRI